MNASPSSIIFVLRSGMSFVTIRRVIASYSKPASMKNCGSTPVTSPPAMSTLSASSPMSPALEPPYTRALPLSPIHVPSSRTALLSVESFPSFAPRYTVMFILRPP